MVDRAVIHQYTYIFTVKLGKKNIALSQTLNTTEYVSMVAIECFVGSRHMHFLTTKYKNSFFFFLEKSLVDSDSVFFFQLFLLVAIKHPSIYKFSYLKVILFLCILIPSLDIGITFSTHCILAFHVVFKKTKAERSF